MDVSFRRALEIGAVLSLVGCGGAGGPNCADGALTTALAGATSGQTVELGACTVHGTFTVPAGVTLHGQGASASRIDSSGIGLVLGAGATVSGLRVDHAAGHGIVAVSVAAVTVRDVEVHSTFGRAALGFADVGMVTLANVTATGPVVDETAAQMLPEEPSATDACLYGVVLQRVAHATLTDVVATGFGRGGVVSSDTTLAWTGGSADGNLGLGVWIDAGSATIHDIAIDGTLRGFGFSPPFGLAMGRGADVHTDGIAVTDTHQGFGIFQDGGDADHVALTCAGHTGGGIVVQRSTTMHVGPGSMIVDNAFAGIVAVQAAGVSIEGTMIARTALAARILASWGSTMIGDGVQIVQPPSTTSLHDVALVGSGRVGLLADLGGMDASLVETVNVSASGTMQFGCVLQDGTGIATASPTLCTRDAVAAAADVAPGMLDVVGIVMPTEIPATGGLVGIVMPTE